MAPTDRFKERIYWKRCKRSASALEASPITRITGLKGGDINCRIQGLSIHAEQHGTGEPATFALVSAIGASVNSSFFYSRTKGEVERDIKLVGFRSLTILRPGIIGGKREESRFAEGVALGLSRTLAPILPTKFHVNPAANIAAVLLDSVIAAEPGCHYQYAESMV